MAAVRTQSRAAHSGRRDDNWRLDRLVRQALAGRACFAQYGCPIELMMDGSRPIVKYVSHPGQGGLPCRDRRISIHGMVREQVHEARWRVLLGRG